MVPAELLRNALDQLTQWQPQIGAKITWVNWRQGFQVKVSWYGNSSFVCFLDFGKDHVARDSVLKGVFEKFAPAGQKAKIEHGHGWSARDYSLESQQYISLNDVVDVANGLHCTFSVLYTQEGSGRPLFDIMGIPLVPGESGKEWINGELVSYSCPTGKNL